MLDSWLTLVSRLSNSETLMDSPHSLPQTSTATGFVPFQPINFLVATQKVHICLGKRAYISFWADFHFLAGSSSFSETEGFFCYLFSKRSPKDAAWKNNLYVICQKRSVKKAMVFMVFRNCFHVFQKLVSFCQIWKSAQKAINALVARYPSIITSYLNAVYVFRVDRVIINAGYRWNLLAEKEVIAR